MEQENNIGMSRQVEKADTFRAAMDFISNRQRGRVSRKERRRAAKEAAAQFKREKRSKATSLVNLEKQELYLTKEEVNGLK